LTHFFDQLPDEKAYGPVMQDCAVVHIAHAYINALGKVFTGYLPKSRTVAFQLTKFKFF